MQDRKLGGWKANKISTFYSHLRIFSVDKWPLKMDFISWRTDRSGNFVAVAGGSAVRRHRAAEPPGQCGGSRERSRTTEE